MLCQVNISPLTTLKISFEHLGSKAAHSQNSDYRGIVSLYAYNKDILDLKLRTCMQSTVSGRAKCPITSLAARIVKALPELMTNGCIDR